MTMKGSRKIEQWSRRRVLRGMLNGGAVTLGLPVLNCFLNESGTAFASGNDPALAVRDLVLGAGDGFAGLRAEEDRRRIRPPGRDRCAGRRA